jgi:hypothetical protein
MTAPMLNMHDISDAVRLEEYLKSLANGNAVVYDFLKKYAEKFPDIAAKELKELENNPARKEVCVKPE